MKLHSISVFFIYIFLQIQFSNDNDDSVVGDSYVYIWNKVGYD